MWNEEMRDCRQLLRGLAVVGQEEAGPPAARVSWVAQTGGGRKLGGFCPGKVVKEGEVGGGDGLGGEGDEQRAAPLPPPRSQRQRS